MLIRLLLALLLWTNLSAHASLQSVISGATDQISLSLYLNIFEDLDANLDIEGVAHPTFESRFNPVIEEQLNLGYSRSVFWLRFSIRWTDSRPLLLQLAYPLTDFIDLYLPASTGGFRVSYAGDRRPVSMREIPSSEILFSLPAIPGTEQTYYLRIQSGGSLQLPLYLWSNMAFTAENGKVRYLHGAYYGIMLALILYNLFLFLFVQDRNYLHFVVYITSYLFFQLSINGYAQYYL